MEMVVFIGIQASGKSSFFHEKFRDTHVRLNLDMLSTRHREKLLFETCIAAKQPFVVDNTNPTVEDRARYIAPAKAAGFEVVGYYFSSRVADSLPRNESRERSVPEAAILGTAARLERPSLDEGFDALYFVSLSPNGFTVAAWSEDGT